MPRQIRTYIIQAVLFLLTIFTTTLVGAYWIGISIPGESDWDFFCRGFNYSIPFLGILTVHEFGHYLTARYYKVDVSLPFYIPVFIPFPVIQIGTMGAFIKMNSRSASKKQIFDIGIAGPLAGFVVAIGVLLYGYTHLPEREHIFNVHPEYKKAEERYRQPYENIVYSYTYMRERDSLSHILSNSRDSAYHAGNKDKSWFKWLQQDTIAREWKPSPFKASEEYEEVVMGKNLIFLFFEKYIVKDEKLIPNQYEMVHYPFLLAGYLALFFTALNLFPIGQLDGGHVLYGLFGYEKHKKISRAIFTIYMFAAGIGIFRHNILGINFFAASAFDMIQFTILYLVFLYYAFRKSYGDTKTTLMVCVIVFASQFLVEYLIPSVEGVSFGLLLGFIIGRFLGTEHPPSFIEEKLDLKRRLLGWFALLVFILCLTPQVFSFEVLKP